ncbi:MAG: membrane protein insertion efficiency factor YidD [Desulfuromonadales bacterium]|nr:membrane protein insertion efficiency factor YidD [Desulfuromonadales bacterium]
MIQKVFLSLIIFYQRFVSPLTAPACRFYPSCSEYALQAIKLYGPWRGLWRSFRRILKCHPFHPGGYDPV